MTHSDLFREYVEELTAAAEVAQEWWGRLCSQAGENLAEVVERWPCGASSHPRVIAVVQKYWKACIELNKQTGESESLSGFLLEDLTGRFPDLAQLVAGLDYWPVGLMPDGKYL